MYDSDFAILIILLADINSLLNFIVHGVDSIHKFKMATKMLYIVQFLGECAKKSDI